MSVVACSGFNCLFACSLLLDFDIVLVVIMILLAADYFFLLLLLLMLMLMSKFPHTLQLADFSKLNFPTGVSNDTIGGGLFWLINRLVWSPSLTHISHI